MKKKYIYFHEINNYKNLLPFFDNLLPFIIYFINNVKII